MSRTPQSSCVLPCFHLVSTSHAPLSLLAADPSFRGFLRTLRRAKGREQVAGAVDQLVAAGVLGEPEAVASVLTVMGRNKHIEEAIELVHRLADPNVVTYNTLIKACNLARDPDLGKAIEVFDEMEAAGVTPNVVTYNTLIRACDNARDLDKAIGVFDEMGPPGSRRTSSPSPPWSRRATPPGTSARRSGSLRQ